MVDATKHFKSFVRLWGKINLGLGEGPSVIVGGAPPYTSYPVPAFHQGKVRIVYMVGPYLYKFGHPNKAQIWPPNKIVWFDPVSGKPVDEEAVTPDYFGQTDSADKPLQINGFIPSGMTVEMFDSLKDRLFVLYDALFEAWVANPSTSGHDKLRDKAREALEIFNQISEKSLRPYYEALGRDWFGWLRALAQ